MIHVVQLTPRGAGAIAVILVAGPGARALVQQITAPPGANRVAALKPGQTCRAMLRSLDGVALDDALAVCTADERFELHTHGGMAVVDAVIDALRHAGGTALPVDRAADLLGSPLEADLLLALPGATTSTALDLLLAQREALAAWCGKWAAHLSAGGAPWEFHSAVQWLLQRSRTLSRLLVPPRIAIIGPPNAGKSTLANAILGRPVAITSPLAGTTRDWVDAQAILATGTTQVAVTLVDTAGIRQTPDPIEHESIRRTHQQAAQADAVILLLDATRALDLAEETLLAGYQAQAPVIAANKCDAADVLPPGLAALPGLLRLSARTGENLPALMQAVLARLDLAQIGTEPFAFAPRHHEILERALLADRDQALLLLSQLTTGHTPPGGITPQGAA